MRVGYAPYSVGLTGPGDRRRFPRYAAIKGLEFELVNRPSAGLDLVILSYKADIVAWSSAPRSSTRVIYELTDSFLALPKGNLWWNLVGVAKGVTRELKRPVLSYRGAIERMCRRADAIICSSPEQRSELAKLNGRVYDILDFHEEVGGEPKVGYELQGQPVLVWEGMAYTVKNLSVLSHVLGRLRTPARTRVITDMSMPRFGAHYVKRPTGAVLDQILPGSDLRPWEKQSMPGLVTECDLAVIPIDLTDPVARAKPENKLLLLWRLGMPVVTSATPAYLRCMRAAGLDLACETVDDWVRAIDGLLSSPEARRRAAEAGQRYVQSTCGTAELVRRWDQALADVVGARA